MDIRKKVASLTTNPLNDNDKSIKILYQYQIIQEDLNKVKGG